ncbi:MAG: polysaccharide biosynthesis/export family protein [Verrucomicrobiota bacterium]|jgi:polysaccharide export outer membrane protein
MKLNPPRIQSFFRPAPAMAFLACVSFFLGLNAAVSAAEAPDAGTQSNAVAPGPHSGVPAVATNLLGAETTNIASILDDKHKLAIGDRLSFRIVEDEEDPKPLFVTDSGDLEVPYIGRVPAENKTCRQLGAEIKAALEKKYYYQATVIIAVDVMAKSQGRVYLVGAVRLPGPVEIPNDEILTLGKAILRAGGFTDYADRRHVKVTRKDTAGKDVATGDIVVKDAATNNTTGKDAAVKEDKETFTVDVGKIFDKGDIEADLPVVSGDLIFVPDRLIRF